MVKILLVEDNPIDAFIAQKVLMLSGAEARLDVADGSAQALKLLENQYQDNRELPDLILVDLYMPGMDGLDFLEAFAALEMPDKNKIIVLMLTNSADPRLNAKAIALGANGIIGKPLSIAVLKDLVKSMNGKEQTLSENTLN